MKDTTAVTLCQVCGVSKLMMLSVLNARSKSIGSSLNSLALCGPMKLKATVIYADTISKSLSSFSPYIHITMNRTFRNRVNQESINTVMDVFHSFVCMLTDEQLQRWWANSVVTLRALSNSVDKDTEQTQQFIREEQLKRDIIEGVCLSRRVALATPDY